MSRAIHIIPIATICLAGIFFIAGRQPAPEETPSDETVETIARPQPVPQEERARDQYQNDIRDQARIAELAAKEKEQGKRERAMSAMVQARSALAFGKYDGWRQLLAKYGPTFETLRNAAAASPEKSVACTICKGSSHLDFCIICPDNTGKCTSCTGTGKTFSDETCPACLGRGKCFLCSGTGKMTCPFCDDGRVEFNAPFPPDTLPVQ